jgi:hypothetical protein
LTHIKYNKLKLALLDKAIKKAEQDKVVRDNKESAETKAEIEKELLDKKMMAEQAEWESKHPEAGSSHDALNSEEKKETVQPAAEQKPVEATPLPTKVRVAQKKQD